MTKQDVFYVVFNVFSPGDIHKRADEAEAHALAQHLSRETGETYTVCEAYAEYPGDTPVVTQMRRALRVWADAPAWARWFAVDACGIGWWYAYKPRPDGSGVWIARFGAYAQCSEQSVRVPADWRSTLQERPQVYDPSYG